MTVKELKEQLNKMPDDAEVLVVDPMLSAGQISAIKHQEYVIHFDRKSAIYFNDIVEICTYD